MKKFLAILFLIALYIVRAPFAVVSYFANDCLTADYVSDVLGEIADEVKKNMAQNIKYLVQEIKNIVSANKDYYVPAIIRKRNDKRFDRNFRKAYSLSTSRTETIVEKIQYYLIDAIVILIAVLAAIITLFILKIFFAPAKLIWNFVIGIIF